MNFSSMIYQNYKKLVAFVVALFCACSCVYDKSSLLSDNDLSFITCMQKNDTIVYTTSDRCFSDTIIIDRITIMNEKPFLGRYQFVSPFLYFEVSNVYEGHISCDFKLIHNNRTIQGWFLVKKSTENANDLLLSFSIGRAFSFDKVIDIRSNDITFSQGDISISKYQHSLEDISSITFQKGNGICSYQFSDMVFQKLEK